MTPARLVPSDRAQKMESFKVMDVLQRANELQASGYDVLHCEVGQPETGAPPAVREAAREGLADPKIVMGYTDAFGLLDLRERIGAHYSDKYELGEQHAVETKRVVVTTGSSGAFLLAFTACFDVGDHVAIASSGYPCYRNILSTLGCRLATIPINSEFKLTAVELESEVDRRKASGEPEIKGLILSSPSNPTGSMLSPAELRDLCVACDNYGIQFISDEIYHGISFGKPEATAIQYSDRAIIINSFSKFYSMSGWRLGWMILPDHLLDTVNSLQQNMFINAPTIAQTAALKCWDADTQQVLKEHVEKYAQSRSIILKALEQIPELTIAPADGGFYIYCDVKDTYALGFGTVKLCQELLETQYVAFTPGIDFEDPVSGLGDRRFRISYAGGIATARAAMDRLLVFWPQWLKRVEEAKAS